MTEPTDHRREAEDWLDRLGFSTTGDLDPDDVMVTALLCIRDGVAAIAHDLHRIADALEPTPTTPPDPWAVGDLDPCPAVDGNGIRCGWLRHRANYHWFPPDDQPGPDNVEADFTEDGEIIR